MCEHRNYRGKLKTDGKWVFGFLVDEHNIGSWILSEPVRPETVGQYTGIYTMEEIVGGDTRCTFIYEGDIVEAVLTDGIHQGFSWGRHVVVFDRGAFGLKDRRGQVTPMCNYSASVKFKVLGNVWDNPELWEGDADA